MEQFFLRAVKAQLPVKANTDLSHRPALAAESLSVPACTMAFLSFTPHTSLCRRNKDEPLRHFKWYNEHQRGRPKRRQHDMTAMCKRFKGMFHANIRNTYFSRPYTSRLFWCERLSFGDSSCRDVWLFQFNKTRWHLMLKASKKYI